MFDGLKAKEMYDEASRQQKLDMVKVIIERKDSSALDFVLQVLRQEEDVFVISSLVKASGILGERTTISILQPYLGHKDGRVRANAVEGLEAIGDEMGWPLIVPLLNDEDHRVRANAARALIQFDEGEARQLVQSLIDSQKTKERATALYFLRTVKVNWSERMLWSFIEKEEQPDLHRLACGLLAESGTFRSIKFLERLSENSGEERKRAYNIALSALRRRWKDHPLDESDDFAAAPPSLTSVATMEPPTMLPSRSPSSLTNSQWRVVQDKKEEQSSWKAFVPIFVGGCIMALAGMFLLGSGARSAPPLSTSSSPPSLAAKGKRTKTVKSRKAPADSKPSYVPARRRSLQESQRRRQLSIARRNRLVGRRKERRW